MQRKLTTQQLKDILSKIKYKNWTLRLIEKGVDVFLVQWIFYAVDNDKPDSTELEPQHCRKWYISAYSTDSEVIRSCHLAVQQAEMHEVNENFTYNNNRLFDPHMDLVELSNKLSDKTIKQDAREPNLNINELTEKYFGTKRMSVNDIGGEVVLQNNMGKTEIWKNGKIIGSQG
jgi:hypothetical protein